MPLHDWKRVSAGTFHGFHNAWITELARALNNGVLPSPSYAEAELVAGQTGPDVLALEFDGQQFIADEVLAPDGSSGVATLLDAEPQVTVTQVASEAEVYSERRNRLAIRHSSGDRLVAYIELLSSGNKASRRMLDRFLDKVYSVIEQGIHLLVVDPYPPGPLDPQGIHAAVWNEIDPSTPFRFPDARHLTAVSYHAQRPPTAYVEPLAVGQVIPDMPLFLDGTHYVNTPLESTYNAALSVVPKHLRERLVEGA
ncbi:MAG: DUF4058 family protein [Pirellulaceae bacterium]|jgi:hypothetical protein